MYRSYILIVVAFSFATACSKGTTLPGPIAVSGGPAIRSITDLVHWHCTHGADVVAVPGENPYIQYDSVEKRGENPYILDGHGVNKAFATTKFINCNEKRDVHFVSLTYEMNAVRVYPNRREPLELFDNGKFAIKGISITDPSPTVIATAEQLSTTNKAEMTVTTTSCRHGGPNTDGILLRGKMKTITLIGNFKTTGELKADRYATRLTQVKAVDGAGKSLVVHILEDLDYEIQVSSY